MADPPAEAQPAAELVLDDLDEKFAACQAFHKSDSAASDDPSRRALTRARVQMERLASGFALAWVLIPFGLVASWLTG